MRWDPAQYERFSPARLRPGLDLLRSVETADPKLVADLGCGTGALTVILSELWPDAVTVGVDSSEEMLEVARASQSRVRWVAADIRRWSERNTDLIFSNAALHWIDNHRSQFSRLIDLLRPGGYLAVQMPANHEAPTHTIAHRLVGTKRWHTRLAGSLRPSSLLSAEDYAHLLLTGFRDVDVWSSTYLHVLSGTNPVTEWVKGSLLRPVLERLDPHEQEGFLAEYSKEAQLAYPPDTDGRTLLPFTRIFIVGRDKI